MSSNAIYQHEMIMRATKCANIIMSLRELYGLSLQEATDVFYQSETAGLIEDEITDLQCRSNKYLATLVWDEFQEHQEQADKNTRQYKL